MFISLNKGVLFFSFLLKISKIYFLSLCLLVSLHMSCVYECVSVGGCSCVCVRRGGGRTCLCVFVSLNVCVCVFLCVACVRVYS